MVKNFISAREANDLTINSEKLLNQVFKQIRDAATYGHCRLMFDVFDAAETVIDRICKELLNAGYTVDKKTDDEGVPACLMINW